MTLRQVRGQLIADRVQTQKVDDVIGGLGEQGFIGCGQLGAQKEAQQRGARAQVVRDDDVFPHRHGAENRGFLEGAHNAFAGHDMRCQIADALAPEQNLACAGLHKRGDQLEQRGLARAVGADDREDFALLDREADLVHRHQTAVAFCRAFDFEDGAHLRASLRSIRLSTPLGSHSIRAIIRPE